MTNVTQHSLKSNTSSITKKMPIQILNLIVKQRQRFLKVRFFLGIKIFSEKSHVLKFNSIFDFQGPEKFVKTAASITSSDMQSV